MENLRKQLCQLLDGRGAHAPFEDGVADFPAKLRGVKPPGAPHSAWQLLEHLRLAQADMLSFSRDVHYEESKWPDDYWPQTEAPPSGKAWDDSIQAFKADAQALKDMVSDPHRDLMTPFPPEKGKPLLRNVLVIADHNAYHIGQLVLLRQLLGAWK
jgi:hypothetical protein